MDGVKRTVLYEKHKALGARMVEFGGWEMPLEYPSGVIREHLAVRSGAGVFDVSHMGRFIVRGPAALRFLQHVLTNNAEALDTPARGAQYTLISNEAGCALDDAFLYRFFESEYLLVVNAANRQKDWEHLRLHLKAFPGAELIDGTDDIAMLALQGPRSREILRALLDAPGSSLPEPFRNAICIAQISRGLIGSGAGAPSGEGLPSELNSGRMGVARTGYTGEPLGFELFTRREDAPTLWDFLLEKGAEPAGLAARDTLRLESSLPLYGHELGKDPEGKDIPCLAVPAAKSAVSFSPLKGDFIGRAALEKQFAALSRIIARNYSDISALPRMLKSVAVTGRGIARPGCGVFKSGRHAGYVTSGTMAPYWVFEDRGLLSGKTEEHRLRAVCLAYLDSDCLEDDRLSIEIRGKLVDAVVVPYHLRSDAPPYARPIVFGHELPSQEPSDDSPGANVRRLLQKSVENTRWRQQQCINLIPSEMTASPMVRLLSVMDPAFRYAEHKEFKAFYDSEIYYYQGTDFIAEVERMLERELQKFLGCPEVETRLISGQMANTAVFSAMVDYINRADRRSEPRRIRRVMNNHIARGGHLSAQPMGALRDFVARDPSTERPAVTNFPVLRENPYKIDIPATLELIDAFRPELIVLGKSMVLHREPVGEIRRYLTDAEIDAVVMYDAAHVLGLIGPYFQQPFDEGADLVTGSTHKTFFGTQRGVIGSRFEEHEERYDLWEAVRRRAFPGSVSNHHLGALLGLLMAAWEMNRFKDPYQSRVIANAKAFAQALSECGFNVAGDPETGFTETHQVILEVGYARGPEVARRLEANNIICNYQATPEDEGFTASSGIRMGVSEMTRFGMEQEDFRALAHLMKEIVIDGANAAEQVSALREPFRELRFCFSPGEYADLVESLHKLI